MLYEQRSSPFHSFPSGALTFHPHLHKEVELFFMVSGSLAVTINGVTRQMNPGDISVAFPNTLHSYQAEEAEETQSETIIFNGDLVSNYQRILTKQRPVYPFVSAGQVHPDVKYVMERLVSQGEGWSEEEELLRGYLLMLLSRLFAPLQFVDIHHGQELLPVERLLSYVDAHFLEPLTLNQLGKVVGVSKYSVSRLFSEKIGCSFPDYLNLLRINYACHLLNTTGKSVTDVGFVAGFNSSSTFYRVFRQQMGLTPLEYREKRTREEPTHKELL